MVISGSPSNMADFASAFYQGSKHYFSQTPFAPGGTGAYAPARYLTHPSLSDHTIYAPDPTTLGPAERLPVLVWANGMGLAWGLMFSAFLREIASHGYIVIANGAPGDTDSGVVARYLGRLRVLGPDAMLNAVRWAVAASSSSQAVDASDVRAHVDGSRIALAGQSKGGLDVYVAAAALRAAGEVRLTTVALFNSGLIFRDAETAVPQVAGLDVPVFYFIGGPADVAYRNAEQDWESLPGGLPAWKGNLGVGHMGTFYGEDANGGRFGRAAVDWLEAMVRGDGEARRRLVQDYDGREGWTVVMRNLKL